MSKDYSNEKHLTLGHLSHVEVANKLLNQTRSTEELLSVCRAGHDRIMHFVQRGVNAIAVDSDTAAIASQLEEVETTIGDVQHVTETEEQRRKTAFEFSELQRKIDALTVERDQAISNQRTAEAATENIGRELAGTKVTLEETTGKLESTQMELTTAYLAKGAAETAVVELQAKLDDLHNNFEIEDDEEGEEETDGPDTAGDKAEANVEYYKPTRDELRNFAVARGFRTRPQPNGTEDLNDYVYDTIYDGIKLSHEKTQH